MDDQVTPEEQQDVKTAKAQILKDMRRIRRRLDPEVRGHMDRFARQHAQTLPRSEHDAIPAEKPKPIPDGHVAYDRERAMQAVGQFIAGKKHDQAFMQKVLKLFNQARQK